MARLKDQYLETIRPALMRRFEYSSIMEAPKLEKTTLNMGVGDAKQDAKMLEAARDQLATIAGQQPNVRRAHMWEFLDRLMSVAIPRIRDFRGLNPRAFDGRGNYSLGIREQIIFPEVDYDAIDQVRGLDVVITTTAATDLRARRTSGCWPAMAASCSLAASSILASCLASPTPMLSVIFSSRGTCIGEL